MPELCLKASQRYGKKLCFQVYGDGGFYNRISYEDLGNMVKRFAAMLKRLGVKQGDRVMILAENRPEWPIAYFGTALAGGITVPVLTDFVPEQVGAIASHAEISALCYTERTVSKITEIDPSIPSVRLDLLSRDLFDKGAESVDTIDELVAISEDAPASIIYTSGTTGGSKGVLLSHKNLVFIALSSRSIMKIYPRDRVLSLIPLAHTYECSIGMIFPLMSGASVTYLDKPPSPTVLLPALKTLRPTAMLTVPLFIEKICRNRIFPSLEKNALYRFPLTRPLAILAAGQKLMSALGSSLRVFGIGGAPLAENVERFLRKARFPYNPGYGLTETAPLISGAAPFKFPFRSVGRVINGTQVRISSEGEIQFRGPNVMLGYYRDEERTRKAFTGDGWFKTGDLGCVDKKGCLYIRGRIKALILGPSGENIYPEEIENMLHASMLVEEALVVPGKRGELVALIVLSEKAQTVLTALEESLEGLKNTVNKKLAAFSRLSRIEVRNEPFEKTPTQKIKRFLYSPTPI